MTSEIDSQALEPDLFGVVSERWLPIILLGLAFAFVGLVVGSALPVAYRSTASVVVEDPQSSALFESSSSSRPDRYVETQIGIISSPAVAQRTSELLAEASPSVNLTPEEVLAGATVISQESSDLISVSFVSESPDVAVVTADAIISAYLELRTSEAIEGFGSAMDQLDESILQAQQGLRELSARIEEARSTTGINLGQEATDALNALIEALNSGQPDSDDLAATTQFLQALESVSQLESLRPELAALLEEQRLAQTRLSNLLTRRNEVAVDAELAGGGFIFRTQATAVERSGASPRAYASIAAVIGLMIGVAVAYTLAVWRRRVTSPEQPESLLQAPALGTIPEFNEHITTALPVANSPQSHAAEAYRFVMAAIESQLRRPAGSSQNAGERLIVVTSSSAQDGRSTFTANIAIAAARSGKRVLIIDADFGSQGVSRLLAPDFEPRVGITEVVLGINTFDEAVRQLAIVPDLELFLLSQGSDLVGGEEFATPQASEMLDSVRERYDLVLIDSPPLPTVGYATTLARLADRVLILVRHRTQVSRLQELHRRLTLVQSRNLGYVYNRAPAAGDIRRTGRPTIKSSSSTKPSQPITR